MWPEVSWKVAQPGQVGFYAKDLCKWLAEILC